MVVNKDSRLENAVCFVNKENRIVYRYLITLNLRKSTKIKLREEGIKSQTNDVRNRICSSPDLRSDLKYLDYEYNYSDMEGNYLFSVIVREKDCKG